MFNENMTCSLIYEFLKKSNDEMEYIKLIKLLYLTDRNLIDKNEAPLTGDNYVAMALGPVLSTTYNLIKDTDEKDIINEGKYHSFSETSEWKRLFLKNDYILKLNTAEKPEIRIKKEVTDIVAKLWERHKDYTWKDMVDHTHYYCSEWQNTFTGRSRVVDIRLEDIFAALGKSLDEIDIIRDKIEEADVATELDNNN